ncbi:MAG: alpha-L-glutamate ligase [Rhodospirillales bacterium]|nr:alpha-L-glutamate ligase [Rhodospirillales bacterium]
MEKIYVIHENGVWVEPLRLAFAARDLAYGEWDLASGTIDLSTAPPEGVFYNRMSASSYTRDHRYAPEFTAAVLSWLEAHGRRIVNSSRALALEVNKAAQYATLQAHGIKVPHTIVAYGRQQIIEAARQFQTGPVILKPNRGGKGDLVQLFDTADALASHVNSDRYQPGVDEIALLQEYIHAPDRSITRAEFIGGQFYYAVRVDTSDGFELCPADACAVDTNTSNARPKFQIFTGGGGIGADLKTRLTAMLAANSVEVAGIEFIRDAQGGVHVYDINTNTNYNSDAEQVAGLSGMGKLADFLGSELDRIYRHAGDKKSMRLVG